MLEITSPCCNDGSISRHCQGRLELLEQRKVLEHREEMKERLAMIDDDEADDDDDETTIMTNACISKRP